MHTIGTASRPSAITSLTTHHVLSVERNEHSLEREQQAVGHRETKNDPCGPTLTSGGGSGISPIRLQNKLSDCRNYNNLQPD